MLLARQPFYAHLLASIPKVGRSDITVPFAWYWETVRPILQYNPARLQALRPQKEWLADWLEEELIHLLLGHPQQRHQYGDDWAFHTAADLEAWQYHSMATRSDTWATFMQRLHLSAPFGLAAAYDRIQEQQQATGRQQLLPGLKYEPLSRTSHWDWPRSRTAADERAYRQWYESLRPLLDVARPMVGTGFARLYNQLQNEVTARMPWQVLLRRFMLSGHRAQSTSSVRRPSRRYGTFPGTRRVRRSRLVVIIDTSGSISAAVRQQFFGELQRMYHLVHELQIIEADQQVRNHYKFTGQMPAISFGGGGTDFDPALRWANQQEHLDGVIYLTDGEGPTPREECRFPLLWLLARPVTLAQDTLQLPGRIAYLDW